MFSTHIIDFFDELFFVFTMSSDSRDGSVILFQWHHCGFFTDFVFIWIVQFVKITFHTPSNHNWKKQWMSRFFKYQFYLIKNKFVCLIKTIITTFQHFDKWNLSITKRHCDSTMIWCVHTYYWFLQRLFFCFFQIDDLIKAKYVFSHFICMFFRDEMLMSMMTWIYDCDFQIFQNESLCKRKWKNCKISKCIDSSWNNWLFVMFIFIFNFFYSIN